MISHLSSLIRTYNSRSNSTRFSTPFIRSISTTTSLDRPQISYSSPSLPVLSNLIISRSHLKINKAGDTRRTIFGFSFPTASNEPLAGTIDGSGPPLLFILQVFLGIPAVLWAYKCLVLVVFQRKIIYLPSVPPGTRDESIAPPDSMRASQLNGLHWKEIEIESCRKTRWLRRPVILKGLELSLASIGCSLKSDVVILYLQGNAGTPLMRVPLFRRLLYFTLQSSHSKLKIVTIAPRSFWLSTRSAPTQTTILADYTSFLSKTIASNPSSTFILYGHSLGGAAALHLLAQHPTLAKRISGIILENPLPSIPYMVESLYPQKWLPYHYLGPLSFDRWDTLSLLNRFPNLFEGKKVLWLRSERDEIVPNEVGKGVKKMWDLSSGDKKWVVIERALHDTAFLGGEWKVEVGKFINEVLDSRASKST